ncbi:hypothetical protein F4819DRAFT_435132 [Hypoxylon fuscum]|nr:hypothetical protein F4819DRAFT_435132 [Hypoxylon fuscum]
MTLHGYVIACISLVAPLITTSSLATFVLPQQIFKRTPWILGTGGRYYERHRTLQLGSARLKAYGLLLEQTRAPQGLLLSSFYYSVPLLYMLCLRLRINPPGQRVAIMDPTE